GGPGCRRKKDDRPRRPHGPRMSGDRSVDAGRHAPISGDYHAREEVGLLIVPGILTSAPAALLAPALHRSVARRTAWTGGLLALLPFALGCWFATQIPGVARGETEPIVSALLGVPELGFAFTFRLDGLSLLFALLICFIGSFVLLYAGRYMEHEEKAGRFFAFLTGFMVSMLGLVLCDNILLVFVFWELTSITSFLLIGFEHEREKARKAALQALLTTGL